MNFKYSIGKGNELAAFKRLALKSWSQFQPLLTPENWERLHGNLSNDGTYQELIDTSTSVLCTTNNDQIVGMAFLVPSGNPTEIYDKDWSYIRFLTVDPDFGGQGIGNELTKRCIDLARENGETTITLHTSEMMDNARRIYENLGFTILKEIEPRLGKRYWLYKLNVI